MACDSPFMVKTKTGSTVPVPCGRCPPCLQRRTNSWAFRLAQEDKIAISSKFITLTYDTTTVPITPRGWMTLMRRDVQLFMKRLRKLQRTKIRYYAVGEYGTRNNRPHYHIIMFNLEDDEHIKAAWTSGGVHIGDVSGASIAYTCKYIAKPSRIPLHKNDDRIPEFSLISKGLGKNYLTDAMVRYHKSDPANNFATTAGGHIIALPRYYRDRIYDEHEKLIQRMIIESENHLRDAQEAHDFYKKYPDGDFEDYKISERKGRHDHYYRNQSPRNL